jgi:hypothetical protein
MIGKHFTGARVALGSSFGELDRRLRVRASAWPAAGAEAHVTGFGESGVCVPTFSIAIGARGPGRALQHPRSPGDFMTRQERLRLDRRDAEGPVRDPLLDSRRIIQLAQRLPAAEVNGPRPPDAPQGEQAPLED